MLSRTLHTYLERLLVGSQRHSTRVFVAGVAVAIVSGVLVSRLSFDTNVLRLLPQDAPTVRAFERFLLDFGSLDHLYVTFESPDPIGEHRDLVDAYVEALRGAPEIESVDAALLEAGKDWTYLYDRELYLLGPKDAALALSRLQPPALDRELAHARDLLQTPSPEVTTMVQQDPLGLLALLRQRFAQQKGFVTFDPTQEGYVSADGRARLVIVKPRGAPFDTDFCKALFRRLAEIERTVRGDAGEGADLAAVTVQAAGAYRVSLEAEALIRRESIYNSVGSLVLLLAIVIAVFRTPWIAVYGTVPLVLGAVLALGLAGVVLGRLSPATSGSAGMLFGLGIDGIILLYMRYLEEREAGASPAEACSRMTGTAFTVMLAELTTVATFLALVVVDFPTLNDLGILVGVGMLLTCAFTLVMIPAMLGSGSPSRGRTMTANWLGDFVVHRSGAIVVAGVVVTLGLGVAATGLRVNMGLERLQARTAGPDLEREVAARFSLPTDVLMVLNENPSVDRLAATDTRLTGALAAPFPTTVVTGLSLVLPPLAGQALVAEQIRRGPSVADATAAVRAAAVRAGFKDDAFEPFIDRLPRLLDADARITHDGLLEHGLESIVSRFIARRDGRATSVTYLYPQQPPDPDALATAVQAVDSGLQLSGLPAINRELERRFPREFAKGVLIGTATVALLIWAVFRTLKYTVLALAPTVVGVVWSAGVLALAGVELDLFSMFAAVTCIGIAVDYGLHVLHRYAEEGSANVREALNRTGAALLIACAATLIGFGTMVNSSYPPLRAFGIVSVVMLVCCFLTSVVLLPAVLVQTDR